MTCRSFFVLARAFRVCKVADMAVRNAFSAAAPPDALALFRSQTLLDAIEPTFLGPWSPRRTRRRWARQASL